MHCKKKKDGRCEADACAELDCAKTGSATCGEGLREESSHELAAEPERSAVGYPIVALGKVEVVVEEAVMKRVKVLCVLGGESGHGCRRGLPRGRCPFRPLALTSPRHRHCHRPLPRPRPAVVVVVVVVSTAHAGRPP